MKTQLENIELLSYSNYAENNQILVSKKEGIETDNYIFEFYVDLYVLFEFSRGSYLQPPELNILQEDLSISDLTVKDEYSNYISLSGEQYDELIEIIKDKIEY